MSTSTEQDIPVSVRPFAAADREAVAEITANAWSGASMAELRETKVGLIDGKPWQEHKVAAVMEAVDRDPGHVLVAVAGEVVVGYATFRIHGDIGTVADNAVSVNWRGRGVATILVDAVVSVLKAADLRLLEVQTFQHDIPARKVYEKFGFEEVASTVHYSLDPTAQQVQPEI